MIEDIEFGGIDYSDAPDFTDAFISYATRDGVMLTEAELDELDSDFVHEKLIEYLT